MKKIIFIILTMCIFTSIQADDDYELTKLKFDIIISGKEYDKMKSSIESLSEQLYPKDFKKQRYFNAMFIAKVDFWLLFYIEHKLPLEKVDEQDKIMAFKNFWKISQHETNNHFYAGTL